MKNPKFTTVVDVYSLEVGEIGKEIGRYPLTNHRSPLAAARSLTSIIMSGKHGAKEIVKKNPRRGFGYYVIDSSGVARSRNEQLKCFAKSM